MISRQDVEHLSKLSRIALSPEEMEAMEKDLESILGYISQIKEVAGEEEFKVPAHRNVMRSDENPHDAGAFAEALLSQLPDRKGEYVRVKKVLKEGR